MHGDAMPKAAARREERGQTMAEYAVVLAVITLAVLLSFQALGDAAGAAIDVIAQRLG